MRNFRKRAEQEAASSSQERSWEVIRSDGKGAGGVFHGILYHLGSPCQEIFCSVLGIGEDESDLRARYVMISGESELERQAARAVLRDRFLSLEDS